MLEGEGAEGWLNEQEAKRFEMEETKKYQYEVKPMVDPAEANKPRSPRTITVPQFSMGSMSNILGDAVTIKAAVSFAVSASIVLSTI